LMENLGNTWEVIDEFIVKLLEEPEPPACVDYRLALQPTNKRHN